MKHAIATIIFVFLAMPARAERMDLNCADHQDDDLISLACNIYWEGRNQSYQGMLAIAAVTLWRTQDEEFPATISDVVWEKRFSKKHGRYYPQFQWTRDGKKDLPFAREQKQWDDAWRIAGMFAVSKSRVDQMCPQVAATNRMWDMLEEQGHKVNRRHVPCEAYDTLMRLKIYILSQMDPTDGSVMYHANYVAPRWKTSYQKVGAVGDHIFYRKEDRGS